jgi:hypothetical protein
LYLTKLTNNKKTNKRYEVTIFDDATGDLPWHARAKWRGAFVSVALERVWSSNVKQKMINWFPPMAFSCATVNASEGRETFFGFDKVI